MKVLEPYSEMSLIQKILAGELALFEVLIRRHNAFLYKAGRSYNYSHEDTQDLMQDTFVEAYLNLSKFENRASFKTWIMRIMLNKCFKRQQKFSFKNEVAQEIQEQDIPMFTHILQTSTDQTVMNQELNFVIENALQQVPLDYRIVFSLREINGLNVSETAEVLQLSEANVKVRLNRAKAMLRKEVERSYSAQEIFEFNLVYCDAMVHRVMDQLKNINI